MSFLIRRRRRSSDYNNNNSIVNNNNDNTADFNVVYEGTPAFQITEATQSASATITNNPENYAGEEQHDFWEDLNNIEDITYDNVDERRLAQMTTNQEENRFHRKRRVKELLELESATCSTTCYSLPFNRKFRKGLPNIHNFDIGNVPALVVAASNGQHRYVEMLIEYGEYVDAKSVGGRTALSEATRNGNLELVKILVERGANLNRKNCYGVSPLIIAAFWGHFDVLKYLLKAGSDVNDVDIDGETALLSASVNGNDNCVSELLRHGADMDILNNEGISALSSAAFNGHIKCLTILLQNGGKISNREELEKRKRKNRCISLLLDEAKKPKSLLVLAALAIRKHPQRKELSPFVPDTLKELTGCVTE